MQFLFLSETNWQLYKSTVSVSVLRAGEANKLPQASQRQDHTNISLQTVTVIYENTII